MAVDKLSLLLKLLDVDIGRPNNASKDSNSRAKRRNKRTQLFFLSHRLKAKEDVRHHQHQDHHDRNVNV
jgi:hypothetical protein